MRGPVRNEAQDKVKYPVPEIQQIMTQPVMSADEVRDMIRRCIRYINYISRVNSNKVPSGAMSETNIKEVKRINQQLNAIQRRIDTKNRANTNESNIEMRAMDSAGGQSKSKFIDQVIGEADNQGDDRPQYYIAKYQKEYYVINTAHESVSEANYDYDELISEYINQSKTNCVIS